MSYATVFKPGGDPYRVWSEVIDELANGLQDVARKVFGLIVRKELDGKLATEQPTDLEIGQELGIAPRTVQKALHALDTDVLEVNDGRPLIDRESGLGCHGRRTIGLTVGLAPSGTRRPAEAPPPQTPPEEFQNTTTRGGSSSSPLNPPGKAQEKTPDPTDPTIAELIRFACSLIHAATPGRVLDVVSVYGAEWVRRALEVVDARNHRPGKKPVSSWGFVLKTLENWQREGGPPEQPAPPVPPAKPPPEPTAPPPKLLPAELLDLVAQCSQENPALRRMAVARVRRAILDGQIPPELIPTIPAEFLPAPEVPGQSSV
jgi:hypothetical protein